MSNLFIAALKEETPGLNKFYHTGVGKLNAAISLMDLLANMKPSKIINYGTVGSLNNNLLGLIKCTIFKQRDMDARGLLNFKLGETPFDKISTISFSKNGYICGSGDNFVSNDIEIICDVVDMEAYALAKIAFIKKIEFECYKFISDYADDNSNKEWLKNCSKGAELFKQKFPECA